MQLINHCSRHSSPLNIIWSINLRNDKFTLTWCNRDSNQALWLLNIITNVLRVVGGLEVSMFWLYFKSIASCPSGCYGNILCGFQEHGPDGACGYVCYDLYDYVCCNDEGYGRTADSMYPRKRYYIKNIYIVQHSIFYIIFHLFF